MLLLLGLLIALTSTAGFAAEPIRDVTYRASFAGPIPTFDKGYLIEYPTHSSIVVYGPDGQFRYEAAITAANASIASVANAAVDSDGTAAVGYATADGGGIAVLDSSGKLVRRIATGRFKPGSVCFSPGHFVWVLGFQEDPENNGREASDYPVLRRYSRDGQETGCFLPRTLFSGWAPPGASGLGLWHLRAAGDRLGALLYPNHSGYEPEWMEVDFDGRLIGRWKLGAGFRPPLAFTSSGRLYATRWRKDGKLLLSRFERQTSSWTDVPDILPPPELYGPLGGTLGADADAIVIPATPRQRLLWLKVE